MLNQERDKIEPVTKKEMLSFIIFILILTMILTYVFFAFAAILILVFFQYIMITLVPDPWTYHGNDPIKVAWIEKIPIFFFIALVVLLSLIIIGFLIKRFKLSFAGSVALILPTFSYLSVSMTWLAGLSALLMLWLPIAETYPEILLLGDCIFFPVYLTIYGGLEFLLPFLIMIIGVFLFIFGNLTWLEGKSVGCKFTDFWIYRYCRHPQYLGYLLATYGMMILIGFRPGLERWLPVPSLFWLLSAICVIGIAMREENSMIEKKISGYENWRNHTPFMIPLPKIFSGLLLTPLRVLLNKSWPENDNEIVITLVLYTILCIGLSIPIVIFFSPYQPLF